MLETILAFIIGFVSAGVILGLGIWLLVKSIDDPEPTDIRLLGSILTGIGIFMAIVIILRGLGVI